MASHYKFDMAEINTPVTRSGTTGRKKHSTRVDLTPMVDLGFLLITFFVFTTALSVPKSLKLFMPQDGPPTNAPLSGALTIFPADNNKVFYYHGDLQSALKTGGYGFTSYAEDGIGKIIRQKQEVMDHYKPGYRKDLVLMIKPVANSHLQQIVSLLDEATINGVSRYTILDATEDEKNILTAKMSQQ